MMSRERVNWQKLWRTQGGAGAVGEGKMLKGIYYYFIGTKINGIAI